MTSLLLLNGIGKKRSEEFSKLNIHSVEDLSIAKNLPTHMEKYKQSAITYLNQHKTTSTTTTPEEEEGNACMNYIFDKHTWLGKQVQIPSRKGHVIRTAIIEEIVLEHGERLVVLCKDLKTKKTSSWQIPILTVLNFELPPLRLSMSHEDMESLPCLEYILSTLWQSDYVRSCVSHDP
jgi:hypothetical protein